MFLGSKGFNFYLTLATTGFKAGKFTLCKLFYEVIDAWLLLKSLYSWIRFPSETLLIANDFD